MATRPSCLHLPGADARCRENENSGFSGWSNHSLDSDRQRSLTGRVEATMIGVSVVTPRTGHQHVRRMSGIIRRFLDDVVFLLLSPPSGSVAVERLRPSGSFAPLAERPHPARHDRSLCIPAPASSPFHSSLCNCHLCWEPLGMTRPNVGWLSSQNLPLCGLEHVKRNRWRYPCPNAIDSPTTWSQQRS